MGAVDSKFLIWPAREILNEMRNRGWFDQLKASFSGYSDCSTPTNDPTAVKSFVRCAVKNAMEPLETNFLIVNAILMLIGIIIGYSMVSKLKVYVKNHIQVSQQTENRNDSQCVNMTMLTTDDQVRRPNIRDWTRRPRSSSGVFDGHLWRIK